MNGVLETAGSNCLLALVLSLVVAGIARLRVNPHVVHVLWLMVLVKFITPPLLRIDYTWPQPAQESLVEEVVISGEPRVFLPAEPLPEQIPEAVPGAAPVWSWQDVLLAAWFAGVVGIIGITLLRILCFRSLLRKAKQAPEWLGQLSADLSRRMGVGHSPVLLLLPVRITPAVWSLFGRPRIVLPAKLVEEMDSAQLETILAHELAHVRRGDHLVRLLELAVTTVFWWNPVVWWVRRNLREMEEQCCDALVLETLPDSARRYAIALIETVEFLSHQSGRLPIGATAARPTVSLTRRIQMLKHGSHVRRLSARGIALMLAVLIVPMTLAFAENKGLKTTELKTKVYRLGTLDAKAVEKTLLEKVAPKDWDKAGGPHSLKRTKNGSLVITASPEVHEKVTLILELRSLMQRQEELLKKLHAGSDYDMMGEAGGYGMEGAGGMMGEGGEDGMDGYGEMMNEGSEYGSEGYSSDSMAEEGAMSGRGLLLRDSDTLHSRSLAERIDINAFWHRGFDQTKLAEFHRAKAGGHENLNQCRYCHQPVSPRDFKRLSDLDDILRSTLRSTIQDESAPADDATFLRRIYLDLLGVPAPAKEMEAFLKDKSPNKRRAKVEELLKRVPQKAGEKKTSKAQMENSVIEQKWKVILNSETGDLQLRNQLDRAWMDHYYERDGSNSAEQKSKKRNPPEPERKSDSEGASLSVPALGPSPVAMEFAFPVESKADSDSRIFSFDFGIAR